MNQDKIAQAAVEVNYKIARAYSTDPRLAIIGYWAEKSEAPKVHQIIDAIIEPDMRTIITIDRKEGSVRSKRVFKHVRPLGSKHIYQEGVEFFGIDSTQLRALEDLTNLEPDDIAEKRINQAINPNLRNMHREYPDHNIIALLKFDLSLEQLALYRDLEQDQIPYIAIFPTAPFILRRDKDGKPYQERLNELTKEKFEK